MSIIQPGTIGSVNSGGNTAIYTIHFVLFMKGKIIMKSTRKFTALFLCGAMVTGVLAGCGATGGGKAGNTDTAEEKMVVESTAAPEVDTAVESMADTDGESEMSPDFSERISFTMTSRGTQAGTDYTSDEFYKYVSDRFNVDIEVLGNDPSEASQKIRLWISSNSLPNCANWEDFNFSEYYEYANQGLLKPLPDGWKDRWPNLAKMVKLSGYEDALEVDGRTYAIPHAVWGTFVSMDPVITHMSLLFRKDWAEQIGMADLGSDYTVTLSDLKTYLEKVRDAGLTADGAWLSGNINNVILMFEPAFGIKTRGFWETEDGFHWSPEYQKEAWIELVRTMRDWYQNGLIDPDYAVVNDYSDGRLALQAGTLAATYDSGIFLPDARAKYVEETGGDYADIQQAHVTADDGSSTLVGANNYWTVQIFAPETEDEVMVRVLDVMDWAAGFEGFCSLRLGIPGVDWEADEDRNITVINEGIISDYISSRAFLLLGWCGDDYIYSGVGGTRPEDIEDMMAVFAAKEKAEIYPLQTNYATYSSDTKNSYSVDITSQIVLLAGSDGDIEAEWDRFIEDNRAMWEPLQNELNEYYGY